MIYNQEIGCLESNLIIHPSDPALKLIRNLGQGCAYEHGELKEDETGLVQHLYDHSTKKRLTTIRGKTAQEIELKQIEYMSALLSTARKLYESGRLESDVIFLPEFDDPQTLTLQQLSKDEVLKCDFYSRNKNATTMDEIVLRDDIIDIDEENKYYAEGLRVFNRPSLRGILGYYYASDAHTALRMPRAYLFKIIMENKDITSNQYMRNNI